MYKVGYVSIRHESRRDITATHYSRSPSLHLKGDWLREAGFDAECSVAVKIEMGCLLLTTG
ncbi:type I toxin-antitoxin system SymE family toxin [Jejubacter calystegiae]|uniref:Type I toxin-antitoxin system SymE family toxin n=1 Tax=Jejubacter calystegiae TaxID=2579935 RepID=A0A4P8YK10_9ENTR|nr:type I toxin-antitoxin system SymE family toxin [Jejubacter calystegiae]